MASGIRKLPFVLAVVLSWGVASGCASPPDDDTNALLLTSITAGNGFTCGLKPDSTAVCWGANQYGQLGVDSVAGTCRVDPVATGPCSALPVAVAGNHRFASIDAGESHVCALTADGRAFCWGDNASGQFGATDSSQTCSVDYYMQRGFGPTPCARTPVPVHPDARFSAISAASGFTCALALGGAARCWGHWTNQRFGGRTGAVPVVAVSHIEQFTQISADGGIVCALTARGNVNCWGGSITLPTVIPAAVKFKSISRGWRHTCGIATDGAAYCWGDNDSGQLGSGTSDPKINSTDSTVHLVESDEGFRAIDAGFVSTCAVTEKGDQYCWGDGAVLGAPASAECAHADASVPCATSPVRTSLADVKEMASGFTHRCALTTGGLTYCWGRTVTDSQRVAQPVLVRHR